MFVVIVETVKKRSALAMAVESAKAWWSNSFLASRGGRSRDGYGYCQYERQYFGYFVLGQRAAAQTKQSARFEKDSTPPCTSSSFGRLLTARSNVGRNKVCSATGCGSRRRRWRSPKRPSIHKETRNSRRVGTAATNCNT